MGQKHLQRTFMKAPMPSSRAMVAAASKRLLYFWAVPETIRRVLSTSRGVVTMPERGQSRRRGQKEVKEGGEVVGGKNWIGKGEGP
jgi:hypothetical protein